MSRSQFFWNVASLNRFPCPFPLGTVRVSMNLITRAARRLPGAVRFTSADEVRKLRPGISGSNPGRNAGAGGRSKSELGGILHHLGYGLIGNRNHWVFH